MLLENGVRPRGRSMEVQSVTLECPVRGCSAPLAWGTPRCVCASGHSFDVARAGYVNLLTPGDKRSSAPGDPKETVRARGRLLDRGFGAHVLEALATMLAARGAAAGTVALDVGCGDGFFLAALAARFRIEGYGVDISTAALKAAARRATAIRWIGANADRRLPFSDGAFEWIFSITSRKNAAEMARLLAPSGRLIVVVPGRDDLAELRGAVLGTAIDRDRGARTEEILGGLLALEERTEARAIVRADSGALRDLLATTYRGARLSAAAKVAGLDAMDVTVSAEIMRFRKEA
jgi:23S rRNA (guanine745-N1)-methyltransferase